MVAFGHESRSRCVCGRFWIIPAANLLSRWAAIGALPYDYFRVRLLSYNAK